MQLMKSSVWEEGRRALVGVAAPLGGVGKPLGVGLGAVGMLARRKVGGGSVVSKKLVVSSCFSVVWRGFIVIGVV